MRYVFDLDGTLCTITNGKYENALPLSERIAVVNKLYEEGHNVTICTARGMSTHSNNSFRAYLTWYNFTKKQITSWGIKYHNLILGKPAGDFYIDDKAVKDDDFFKKSE